MNFQYLQAKMSDPFPMRKCPIQHLQYLVSYTSLSLLSSRIILSAVCLIDYTQDIPGRISQSRYERRWFHWSHPIGMGTCYLHHLREIRTLDVYPPVNQNSSYWNRPFLKGKFYQFLNFHCYVGLPEGRYVFDTLHSIHLWLNEYIQVRWWGQVSYSAINIIPVEKLPPVSSAKTWRGSLLKKQNDSQVLNDFLFRILVV